MYPERKNPQYSEEGIRNFIDGNLWEIEMGRKPVITYREPYRPYKKHPKYKGILALYVHYLYILGKIQKQQYPPRMTAQMKQDVMRFEQLREQFKYLRENGIETPAQTEALQAELGDKLKGLTKQRTILNVQKKKQKKLFDALSDEQALAPAKRLYEEGHAGMETEYAQYMAAVSLLDQCGIPREQLLQEKTELYSKLADLNREIRQIRKQIKMCDEIQRETGTIERQLQKLEPERKERQHQQIR